MSRSLVNAFAGVGGAALLAAAGGASAQDLTTQDFTVQPLAASAPVSDEWRVVVNPTDSPLAIRPGFLGNYPIEENPIYSLQREIPIRDNMSFSFRFEAQRPESGAGGLVGMIRSGSLPLSGGEQVPGEGKWGLKFKKGVSIQWKYTW